MADQITLVPYKNNRTGQTFKLRKGSVAERRVMAKFRGLRTDDDKPLVEQAGKPQKVTPKSRRQRREERLRRQAEPQGQGG